MREMIALKYDIRMTADDSAEITVYGLITSSKWDDTDVTAKDFNDALNDIKGTKNLNLRINSPGGHCFQAVAMRAMLINAGFENLTVSIEGLCASAATLLASVPGATVKMSEGSMYMIHNPWSIAMGDAADFENEAELLRKMESDYRAIYAKRCGKDDTQIKEWMDKETWFTAAEAVDAGFADEVDAAAPIAACVSEREWLAMSDMYLSIPDGVKITNSVSTASTAGDASENTKPILGEANDMEDKVMTVEELKSVHPELYETIMQAGAESERERTREINDMTPQGYEAMAETAVADGTSAADYLKAVVKAQRDKKGEFMANRRDETKPAEQVVGGASEDTQGDPQAEIKAQAKEIAGYAAAGRETPGGMY